MASYWSLGAYAEWQKFPILTSVKTTGLPVTQIEYPAITICSQGSISQVFRNVREHQFSEFVRAKGLNLDSISEEQRSDLRSDMSNDLYPGLGQSPEFIVDALTWPNPEAGIESKILVHGGFDPCVFQVY